MATASALVIYALVLSSAILAGAATIFPVGGEYGWREPDLDNADVYDAWATSHRFRVGDSLEFVYENDTVVEVEKWGYYHCDASEAIVEFDNGRSHFVLDKPGAFYYVSGDAEHCKNGQRLVVEVMGERHREVAASPQYVAGAPVYPVDGPYVQPTSGDAFALVGSFVSFVLPVVMLLYYFD